MGRRRQVARLALVCALFGVLFWLSGGTALAESLELSTNPLTGSPTPIPSSTPTPPPAALPSSYSAQILEGGKRLVFSPVAAQLLQTSASALLQVEFEKGGTFSQEQFGLALNGIEGVVPTFFDLSTVSVWLKSNGRNQLRISAEKLRFDNGLFFTPKAARVVGGNGSLVIWLRAPLAAVAAELVFSDTPTIPLADTSPVVVLDVAPARIGDQTSVAFQFHAGTGLTQFQCSLDRNRFSPCSSPISYTGLAIGPHRFEAQVAAQSGELAPITVYPFDIIRTVPGVVIQSENPSSSPTSETSLAVSFSIPSYAKRDVKRNAFCQLDGGAFAKCTSPVRYTGLLDGLHTIVIQRGKRANLRYSNASYSWTVVTVAPVAQWLGTPASLTNSSSASFSFQANQPSQFSCALDGESPVSCESPYALSSLSEGTHVLSVTAANAAGVVSQPISFTWTVDLTPPVVTLQGANPPQSPNNSTSLSLSFSASEASTFTCALDAAPPAACNSPIAYSGLADGSHSITLVATDLAGNVGQPVVYSWVVDTVAPVVSLQMVSPSSLPTNSGQALINVISSEAAAYSCTLNGGAPFVCSSPLQLTALQAGTQTLTVVATDAVGNVSQPVAITWLIDQTPPVLTITSVTPPDSVTSSQSIQLAFENSKPATTFCELDQSGLTPCTSPFVANGLADGVHTVTLGATDDAGNAATPLVYSWEVASVSVASISQVTPPGNPVSSKIASFQFSATNAVSFVCSLDGSTVTPCSSPQGYSALADGSHTFSVQGVNVAGAAGPAAAYTWVVDTASPTVTLLTESPSQPTTNQTGMSISFSASSETSATFACALDSGAAQPCTSPWSASGLSNGSHTFSVVATDAAGNQSQVVSYVWVINTTSPLVTLTSESPSQSPTNSTTMSIAFSSSEPATFACSLDSGAAASCASPWTASGLANGPHTFSVTATDSAGNKSNQVTYSWAVDTTPPVVTLISESPSWSPTSNTSLTLTFSASESATFSCALDGGTAVSCASPYTVSALASSAHTLSVTATDQAGNHSTPVSYSWTVNTAPLTVTNLAVSQITASSAVVTWTTIAPATSQVLYGPGNLNHSSALNGSYVTSHSVSLTGLSSSTSYSVEATSVDRDGRTVTSSTLKFSTLR